MGGGLPRPTGLEMLQICPILLSYTNWGSLRRGMSGSVSSNVLIVDINPEAADRCPRTHLEQLSAAGSKQRATDCTTPLPKLFIQTRSAAFIQIHLRFPFLLQKNSCFHVPNQALVGHEAARRFSHDNLSPVVKHFVK
jgi:hypothetical protein